MPMTQGDFLRMTHAVRGVRVLDVDSEAYRSLVGSIESFEHLDLCWLASQHIHFVSAIARRVIATRFPNSIHAA